MVMIVSVIMTQINQGVQHAQPNIIKKNTMVNTYLYRCNEFKVLSTVGQHFISVGMGMELSLSNKPAGFKMDLIVYSHCQILSCKLSISSMQIMIFFIMNYNWNHELLDIQQIICQANIYSVDLI